MQEEVTIIVYINTSFIISTALKISVGCFVINRNTVLLKWKLMIFLSVSKTYMEHTQIIAIMNKLFEAINC